jgi:hypothetical protein
LKEKELSAFRNLQIGLQIAGEKHRVAIGAFLPEVIGDIPLLYESADLGTDKVG